MAINQELEIMYEEDKKQRENCDFENREQVEELDKDTKLRILKTKKLLPDLDTSEIWNCHYVAYLLQHGEGSEDYKLAHDYAEKAVKLGSKATRWLYAATLDRWLVSLGKKQKYGTQFLKTENGWVLAPMDNSITDEERISWGVPARSPK